MLASHDCSHYECARIMASAVVFSRDRDDEVRRLASLCIANTARLLVREPECVLTAVQACVVRIRDRYVSVCVCVM